ncbi:MAG: methylated-DNA--[protein]-cysteine S-methyltransferase [Gammaproteobacteria bacterium]|nr:methylated-DNA--[protein]-cysteine S-methyltransferase [Gammaproteobacteria bacterium]
MSIGVATKTRAASVSSTLKVSSPLGILRITHRQGYIVALDIQTVSGQSSVPASDPFAKRIVTALQHYFSNPRSPLRLPLVLDGTEFQQRVWSALQAIPVGQTRSYGELARQLGSSARAVGNACRRNPVAVIVPCHRVIAAHGLGGYAGKTSGRRLQIKRWLLQHEGIELA